MGGVQIPVSVGSSTRAQDRLHTLISQHGACVGQDQIPWFPDGHSLNRRGQAAASAAAAAACAGCPVMAQCRTWAIQTSQRYGVWGGLAQWQLRELQLQNLRARAVVEQPAELDDDPGQDDELDDLDQDHELAELDEWAEFGELPDLDEWADVDGAPAAHVEPEAA